MTWHAIAALDWQGVIGFQGRLPWRLPADLARFRQVTAGHTVLMGRKTFESIGHALPHRRNLVVSQSVTHFDGAECFEQLEQALAQLGPDEIGYVIGGAQIYRASWPQIRRLHLTVVDGCFEGDAYFPKIEEKKWKIARLQKFDRDGMNPFDCWFVELCCADDAPDLPCLDRPFLRALQEICHC